MVGSSDTLSMHAEYIVDPRIITDIDVFYDEKEKSFKAEKETIFAALKDLLVSKEDFLEVDDHINNNLSVTFNSKKNNNGLYSINIHYSSGLPHITYASLCDLKDENNIGSAIEFIDAILEKNKNYIVDLDPTYSMALGFPNSEDLRGNRDKIAVVNSYLRDLGAKIQSVSPNVVGIEGISNPSLIASLSSFIRQKYNLINLEFTI